MLEIIIAIAVIILDQATKLLAAELLTALPNNTYPLIKGVFELTYVENRGAAFGLMQNARVFFIIATVIVCAGLIYFMVREHKKMHTLLKVALALILGGAVGNLIDRAILGYVRDMLSFTLINFAVFNVADSALTVGATILVLDILFGKSRKLFADDKKQDATSEDAKDADAHGPEDDA